MVASENLEHAPACDILQAYQAQQTNDLSRQAQILPHDSSTLGSPAQGTVSEPKREECEQVPQGPLVPEAGTIFNELASALYKPITS